MVKEIFTIQNFFKMNNRFCYVAGKITGLPVEEYKKNFKEAECEILALDLLPKLPIELPHEHDKSWHAYMREGICCMLTCGYVYALKNWHESRGAKIEVELAILLGLKIFYQEDKK